MEIRSRLADFPHSQCYYKNRASSSIPIKFLRIIRGFCYYQIFKAIKLNRIIIVNEISRAFSKKLHNCYYEYSPNFHSQPQRFFFERRFEQIKKICPDIVFQPNKKSCELNGKVFAWDAEYELRQFGECLVENAQNRLASRLSFDCPDSFSAFRRKLEPHLPDHFNDAIEPTDKDVKNDIDFYFDNKRLPHSYLETRNQLTGKNFSSNFSCFLSCGALDVRFLYNCIKNFENEYGESKSSYWLVFELLWREFFYWNYKKHNRLYFSDLGIKGKLDFQPYKKYSFSILRRASKNSFWNAALNELEETGYHSNRTRQLFASFWIHDLNFNWRSGADFYEKNLIDYDVFSNWGNWMYIAGVGASAQKRHFHIVDQLNKYDPDRDYFKKWL